MPVPESNGNKVAGDAVFTTTRWTLVLSAGDTSTPESLQALSHLCRSYWYPLYAFARRSGSSVEDAEDLTQSFFAHLIEKKALRGVERGKGRFRSFLLASMKHFAANEWDKARAEKRGGKFTLVSLDDGPPEERYRHEPSHNATPERLYEQSWALTVVNTALSQLRDELAAVGKSSQFEALKDRLVGAEDADSYSDLTAKLGMQESAIRTIVHRMRRDFARLLRAQVAETVESPEEIEDELRHLISNCC